MHLRFPCKFGPLDLLRLQAPHAGASSCTSLATAANTLTMGSAMALTAVLYSIWGATEYLIMACKASLIG